jgi:carboxyl-terminal processing protease
MGKRIRLMIAAVVMLCLLSAVSLAVDKKEEAKPVKEVYSKEELYGQLELFTDVLAVIQKEYVDKVEAKKIIQGALRGMMLSLDPYSQFLDPDAYKEIKVESKGRYGGLGIVITVRDGLLTVISPMEDTPAWRAGIKPRDIIVKIDDKTTQDITITEAVKKLRGKPGSKVHLTIMRRGESELLEFEIVRDIIKIKSVKDARVLEDNIGYVKILDFQENTADDLEKALKKLEAQGIDSLILDLRNNPGGLLDSAVEVAEKFLPANKVVVSTRGRRKTQNMVFKSQISAPREYPMVVLVNEGSASGSEIVAGALQDYKRAILLGKKTFGKGSVQTIIPLKDGSALRLTTSKYYTPNGRMIHEKGLQPDVQVELAPPPKEKKLQEKEVFEKVKHQEKPVEEILDNQVLRAMDLLKGIKIYQKQSSE